MNIDDLNEQIKLNEAVMIYFSGQNCGVCKVLKPKIKELLDNNFPKIKQIYIDANKFQQTAISLNIFAVPTVVIYLDQKEFIRKSRNFSISALQQELQRPYDLFLRYN